MQRQLQRRCRETEGRSHARLRHPERNGQAASDVEVEPASVPPIIVAVARPTEPSLAFRTLHASPLVRVSGYVCRACESGPSDEEHNHESTIVFMRHGAFRQHFGAKSVTADVNQAM